MSVTADPLFVAAEIAYRRETFAAGLPRTDRSGRRHARWLRLSALGPRLHHRHSSPRTA